MRLSFLILSLAIPASAIAAGPPAPSPEAPGRCAADRVILAEQKRFHSGKAPAQKLGELPPGKLYLTVDRQVDGCRKPVIVRYNIGATEAPRGH
jgi:hypothetical protein